MTRTASIYLVLLASALCGFAQGNATATLVYAGALNVVAAQTEITNGLLAWYKFDEGSGTLASDTMGNYVGTNENTTYVDGLVGPYAQYFNGTNSRVTLPSFTPTNITVSMWVCPYSETNISNAGLISKYSNSSDWSYRLVWGGVVRKPIFYVRIGGSERAGVVSVTLNVSNWVHLAAVHDGELLTLYTNGVIAGDSVALASGSIQSTTVRPSIGALTDAARYNGLLDDVRIYGRGLLPSEVYAISGATNLYSTNTTVLTNIVTDGDSMTAGVSYTPWPTFISGIVPGLNVENIAVSGQNYLAMLQTPQEWSLRYSPSAATNIATIWNSNDIKGGSVDTLVEARIAASIRELKSRGYGVAVATILKRGDYTATMEGYRTNVNNWIVTNAASLGASWVVNLATNELLDYTVHPENFDADTIHPNNTGEAIVATNMQVTIFP